MERDFVRAGAAGDDIAAAPDGHPEDPQTATEAAQDGPDREWKFYDDLIQTGLMFERRWRHEAATAEKLYFGPDDDPHDSAEATSDTNRKNDITDKTALIHANVDVLKPLVYSSTPIPIVRRRFRGDGRLDPTALYCAEVGQRLAEYLIDTEDFDATMQLVRDDWLIAGRGVSRVVYKADFKQIEMTAEPGEDWMADPGAEAEPLMEKAGERVCPMAMDWRRVVFAPSENWRTMPWMAFEVPMTRAKIERRFGPEYAERIAFNSKGLVHGREAMRVESEDGFGGMRSTETGARQVSPFDTATVWEFWDRESGEVVWLSPDHPYGVLDRVPDPLGLRGFFPSPKPLLASRKGDSMTPRPDIAYYENRAKEINKASRKLEEILNVMSVSAFVPGQMQDQVADILSGKSKIIPVAEWMKFMEKGGANMIQWLPLQAMVAAIQALVTLREQAKMAMFEASGVSDLMRAQGDPSETATAQELKGRYAGMRLSDRQKEAAIHARDLLNLMMEVALEHFDAATIAAITDLDLPVTEAERMQIALTKQQQEQAFAEAMQQFELAQMLAQQGLIDPMYVPQEPPPPPPEIKVPPTSYEAVQARLRNDFMRQVTLNIETDSTILADEQSDKEARIEFLTAFSTLAQNLMPLIQGGQIDMGVIKELLLFGVRGFPKARTLENLINDLPDDMPQGEEAPDVSVQVAQIKAEVDQAIAALESEDKEKDRQHELRMKGVGLMQEAAEMQAEAAAEPPPQPQPDPQTQGA